MPRLHRCLWCGSWNAPRARLDGSDGAAIHLHPSVYIGCLTGTKYSICCSIILWLWRINFSSSYRDSSMLIQTTWTERSAQTVPPPRSILPWAWPVAFTLEKFTTIKVLKVSLVKNEFASGTEFLFVFFYQMTRELRNPECEYLSAFMIQTTGILLRQQAYVLYKCIVGFLYDLLLLSLFFSTCDFIIKLKKKNMWPQLESYSVHFLYLFVARARFLCERSSKRIFIWCNSSIINVYFFSLFLCMN